MRKERERRTYEPFHSYGFGDLPPGKDYPYLIAKTLDDADYVGVLERKDYIFIFNYETKKSVDEGELAEMMAKYNLFPMNYPALGDEALDWLMEIYEKVRNAPMEKTEPSG